MKQRFYFLIPLILGLIFFQAKGFSEGSKEIYIGSNNTWLFICTDNIGHCNGTGNDRSEFASYGCADPDRLYFTTVSNSETIFMGFNGSYYSAPPPGTSIVFEIRDMSGTIVFPETSLPTSGTGFISNIGQARVGPLQIYGAGGYTAIDFHPATPGDFYIEFAAKILSSGVYTAASININLIDITIQDTVSSIVTPGRLNSKSWQFFENGANCSSTTYIYSVDSIITSCASNNMKGGIWVQFCNQWGCANTGNFPLDRKSRTTEVLLPQYKIFLNNPDINLYPPATTLGQIIPPQPNGVQDCNTGHITYTVNVDKPGSVEIDLSFPGPYVTRVLTQTVATGSNTIIWDGLDGTTPVGVPVPNGVQVTFTVKYINGLTNLPFYDIEGNPNGFVVALVNPPGTTPLLYWDDSNIPVGTTNFTGCSSPPGCHVWTNPFGNNRTINTWWYNVSSTTSPVQITQFRHAGTLTFVQPPTALCAGSTGNLFSVNQDINTEVFHWSYTGTGATIHQVNPSDYFVTVDFAVNATSGSLQVYGTNSNCLAAGPTASLSIIINPVPVVNSPSPNTICTGVVTNINLTSIPASTNFSWVSPPPTCSANIVTCPPGQTNSNLISDVLTLTNSTPGTVTYHIISTLNNCSSTPQDFTLNVLPSPTPVVTGSTNVCAGSSGIVYSTDPGMTGYTWSISAGGTITAGMGTNSIQATWTTPGVQSVTLSYTDVNSCATIIPTVYPVTVNTLPTASISGTKDVCQNDSPPLITFTGNSAATPYTFTYNINGGSNQVVTTAVGNTVNVAVPTNVVGSFTYNLISVQDGSTPPCSQPQGGSATVNVNPLPTATIAGTLQVCQNSAAPMITFTGASTTAPYTFTYNINGGGDQVVTTVVGNSVNVAAPTNVVGPFTYNLISVQDGSPTSCSQLQPESALITVNPLPTASISGNIAVCQNAPSPMVTFTGASSTAPYTFTYNINGGANLFVTTVAGNSVNVAVPTTPPGTYVYNLLSVKDAGPATCSQNQPESATVIVNPLPVPTISGPLSVCANSIATYTTEASMTNYSWTILGGGVITLGSTTNTITVQWGPANGTYTIQVNYINSDGCTAAAPTPVNITVNTLPTPTITGSNNVCSGLPTQIYSTQVGMSNYSWAVSAGGSISGGGATTDNTVTILWNTAGAQTVSVNYVVGTGCTAPLPISFPVIVHPRPSITNAANSTQCSGLNTSISPSADLGGTTFSWTATPSSGNVTGFNAGAGPLISDNLVNSGFNVEFVDYVVTPSLNGCDGGTATYRVFVNPVADVYFNPNGQTFCSGGTSNISILSHTVVGTTFTWTAVGSSGNISGFGPGATSTISQTLTSIGTGPEFVTYNVSPSFGGCPGSPGSVIVHVNPNPVVSYPACTDIITTTAAQPIKLKGGIPLGGIYSGASVIASTFYPSIAGVGNHTLTYSYSNTWGCTANATQVISVVNPPAFVCDNQLMDIRDNFSYATVKLGAQCWMAANLNYGNTIASGQMQRDNCTPEKYCYNDIPGNCLSFGGFYQWDEIMQYDNTASVQGLCPPGWHVPSEGDWQTLFNFYTSNGFAGSPLKSSGFSGFNALLDGTRFDNVNFYLPNFATFLWSSTSEGITKAWAHAMNNPDPSVSTYPGNRSNAFNVRCIKD